LTLAKLHLFNFLNVIAFDLSGQSDWIAWGGALVNVLNTCETRAEGEAWIEACRDAIANCARDFPKVANRVALRIDAMRQRLPDAGEEPPIFGEFRSILSNMELYILRRFEFYDAARGPDLALVIATGERRIYANILLTIGVVSPAA
jgi:hypothetical protein